MKAISFAKWSDEDVFRALRRVAGSERRAIAYMLVLLGEAEHRSLHAKRRYPSLFEFCRQELRLAEGAAYRRVQCTRAARKFPVCLSFVRDGSISLTTLAMLSSHLTRENAVALLDRAQNKSRFEIEAIVAGFSPKAPKRDVVRVIAAPPPAAQLPAPSTAPALVSGDEPPMPQPAPARARIAFDCSAELIAKLERVCAVLRHKYPAGKYEDIFAEALEFFLERKDPDRVLRRPGRGGAGAGKRAVPRRVQREVWRRDGGRCAFVGGAGRCPSRENLEFDHVKPWALGGTSDDPANIRLLCRTHNRLAAEVVFGRGVVRGRG